MEAPLLLLICLCRGVLTTDPNQDAELDLIKSELAALKSKTELLERNYTLLESVLEKKFKALLDQEKAMVLEKFQVLQQDVLFVNQQFSKLSNISGTHDDRVPGLQIKISQQDSKISSLDSDTQSLQTKLSAYGQDLYALKNTVAGMKINGHNPVAFKATIHEQPALNAGDAIMYNHLDINEGNAYNPSTGIFTCPQRGLYKFVSFMKKYEEAHLHFRRNGQKIDNSFDGYPNSTSISTIMELNVGDKVWVSHEIGHLKLLYTPGNYKMTGSFVGYLMSI